jgi:hypothetical protein
VITGGAKTIITMPAQVSREALNKSPLARRWPLRDGMHERRRREWLIPFARSLTRQTARKASSPRGCGKIGRSSCCAPWHRSPGYDLRRVPYDHPDFTSNALSEDWFRASLGVHRMLSP